MLIVIDNQSTEVDLPEGDFSAAVKGILKYCADESQVVTSITVDGTQFLELEDESFLSHDRGTVERVEVSTQSVKETAENILHSAAEGIPQLIEEFTLINQDLQSRNLTSGLERTENALTYWISIVDGCLKAIQVLGHDLNTLTVSISGEAEVTGMALLEKINSLLGETQTAFENQDNLEIGDIFEYDLPPLLRSFQGILFQLTEKK